jgi:hypothetical protein
MKKILTIVMLCLLTSAYSQEEIRDRSIDANLSFGKYTDCLRPGGICTFKTNEATEKFNTKVVFNKDKTLTIHIKRDQITLEDEIKIGGQEIKKETNLEEFTFLMEEEIEIPEETRMALKVPEGVTKIATGAYPVTVTEKEFIITLKLI